MQAKDNLYWEHKNNQQVVIVSTCTIVHPNLDVSVVTYMKDTQISFFNRKKLKQYQYIKYVSLVYITFIYLL